MITVYDAVEGKLIERPTRGDLATSVWIDLLNPGEDEDKAIEQALGIEVPTRSEMREIEASNRFYTENGAYYMTSIILHHNAQDMPLTSVITFILSGPHLVTVRYAEPKAFPVYVARAAKGDADCVTGAGVMIGLLQMLIEREADLIERVQDEVERIAPLVFGQKGQNARNRRLDVLLRTVGKEGDIVARAQESAMSLHRLSLYFANAARERKDDPRVLGRIEAANHDILSLMESMRFLSARCHAWHDLDGAEPDHQAVFGYGGDADAADPSRIDLRHELQDDARAGFPVRLSDGARPHVHLWPGSVSLFQEERLALRSPRRS